MSLITLLYVPLVVLGMYYLRISVVGSMIAGLGMLWLSYVLSRHYTREELLAPFAIMAIGLVAYLFNHPLILKLYPLLLSLAFLAYFVVAYVRRSYPLIGWVEKIKKRPLSLSEREDIIRSHLFWIAVLLLNTAIHLSLSLGDNITWWAAYAFAGWYLLFGVAITLQILYVHRLLVRRVIRSIWGYGLFGGVIAAGFIPAILAYAWSRLRGDRKAHIVFQSVASAMFRIFFAWMPGGGVRLEQEPKTQEYCIYVATHESWIDYPLVGSFVGDLYHLTNKKNAFIWFLRPIARLLGVRDAITHNPLHTLLQCLRDHSNVLIFPEGSRSIDGSLGAFKQGAFSLSIASNVPVVPVIIEGTRERVAKGSYLWAANSSGEIHVKVLSPVYPLDGEDAASFGFRVHEIMQAAKERLREDYTAAAVKKS